MMTSRPPTPRRGARRADGPGRGPDPGHGHELEPLVTDPDEILGDDLAQSLPHSRRSRIPMPT